MTVAERRPWQVAGFAFLRLGRPAAAAVRRSSARVTSGASLHSKASRAASTAPPRSRRSGFVALSLGSMVAAGWPGGGRYHYQLSTRKCYAIVAKGLAASLVCGRVPVV